MSHRKYELKQRALGKEATRRRIVEATVELHAVIGPAATTISAVAEHAGVERLTVYRHFPSMRSLFEACGALTLETYPPPAFELALAGRDALDYVEEMLAALYDYYERREVATSLFLADAERVPDLREIVERNWTGYLTNARDLLLAALSPAPSEDLRVFVGQALDFWAWRSLHRQGLTNVALAKLQRRLVTALLPEGAVIAG